MHCVKIRRRWFWTLQSNNFSGRAIHQTTRNFIVWNEPDNTPEGLDLGFFSTEFSGTIWLCWSMGWNSWVTAIFIKSWFFTCPDTVLDLEQLLKFKDLEIFYFPSGWFGTKNLESKNKSSFYQGVIGKYIRKSFHYSWAQKNSLLTDPQFQL